MEQMDTITRFKSGGAMQKAEYSYIVICYQNDIYQALCNRYK